MAKKKDDISEENRMFIEAAMKQNEAHKKHIEQQLGFTREQQQKYGVGKKPAKK